MNVHFVLLDACYYQEDDSYFAYENGNYKKTTPNAKVPILPPSEDVTEKYPKLERMFSYRDPLYAIVENKDGAVYVHGRESEFVGAAPEQMCFEKEGLTDDITASVIDRTITI